MPTRWDAITAALNNRLFFGLRRLIQLMARKRGWISPGKQEGRTVERAPVTRFTRYSSFEGIDSSNVLWVPKTTQRT